MAESKASFVLYADLLHTVKKLPPEKAGELFLTILKYVNDENPAVDDPLIDLVFEPIKQQLKRDLVKWEVTKKRKSDGGRKSAELRKAAKEMEINQLNDNNSNNSILQHSSTYLNYVEDTSSKPADVNLVEDTSRHSTVNVNDNVNVTVNVNDNVIKEINKESSVLPIPNHLGFYLDMSDVKKVLLQPSRWQDVFCMQAEIKLEAFAVWIEKFYNHAIATGKDYKQPQPFQEHFANWIRKQDVKFLPPETSAASTDQETPTERRNRLAKAKLNQR